jgi:hypothetical protein
MVNLKVLMDELSVGKPLLVAIAHAHPDHSWGNCQFERVYCHEQAMPEPERSKIRTMRDYLFEGEGRDIWQDFNPADLT